MSNSNGSPFYLVLDQGGHASRAMVFNTLGEAIAESSQSIYTNRYDDCVELDADEVVSSLKLAMEDVAQQLGSEVEHIRSAALATQRSNMVCWRRSDGAALSPILSWQDRRAEEKLQGIDKQAVHRKTGLFANAHYGASKMTWCLEHIPAVKQAEQQGDLYIGPMASFLASRLTGGTPLADPSNASRTLLWNIHTQGWDNTLCHWFGIRRELLPECVASDHGFGDLQIKQYSVPLQLVIGDLSAAAFANGWPQSEVNYITLGTGAFIQRATERPISHPRLLTAIQASVNETSYLSLEGTVNGAASAIEWLAQEHQLDARDITENLTEWLDGQLPAPAFANAVSGLGSPVWCAHAHSRFEYEADLPQQASAIIESIIFLIWLNLLAMQEAITPAREIVISGGLANIDPLCQQLADLSTMKIQRSEETEATAKGAAICSR
ncbi:MAG: hypothetical protein HUJ30_03225 [Gammaproteobacteria bacterium]|nr:hypothetical protein [Gammaproteobacteria bacterium]